MPKVFADEQADATEAGVEGLDGVTPGEEAAFVEEAVGGQINFVVDVEDAPARKVGRSDVETVTRVFIHKADNEVEVFARLEQMFEDGIIVGGMVRDGWDDILQDVACEGEFGENEQVRVLGFSLLDEIEVLLEVGLHVPQFGGDLSESEVEFHRGESYH